MLWLTRDDVQAVLTMPAAIDAVANAFRLLSLGHAELPLRTNMPVPPHQGSLLTMPAYVGESLDALGVKLITVYPENPADHGLPAIQGLMVLFRAQTGEPLAVMEAGPLTGMRTGAAGGVAIRYLAREDALSLTLFGTGAQAPYQLEAALCERLIERVWIVSRDRGRAHAFAHAMRERFGLEDVRPATDVEQAVRDADIIVTATAAQEPLFDGRWVHPGTHINAVGAHLPHAREVDTVTVQRARVVVDQRAACLAEAGDLIIPLREGAIREDHIAAEIGEIVAGLKPGRTRPDEITLFKSVGLAVQDVAVAAEVVRLARIRGVGQEVPL